MNETSNISEIVTALKSPGIRLIGIDGMKGSGKSKLAESLSTELDRTHINLDDYVEKNRGTFVDYVDYDAVQKRAGKGRGPIIIEGVCLLAVLEELQLSLGVLIYVKRINDSGVWGDEDDCDVVGDIDDFMAETKQRFVRGKSLLEGKEIDPDDAHKYPRLHEEIIRYHHRFRPQDNADIIYRRMVTKTA